MTNVRKTNDSGTPKITKNKSVFLDKLEQLVHSPKIGAFSDTNNLDKLQKRARAKFMTNSYVFSLACLRSPLQKAYNTTIYGCAAILLQVEDKITGSYCGYRWCLVCSRIRTAKLINGYLPQLEQLENKYFVTLTVPNCLGEKLKSTIDGMIKNVQLINKLCRRNKTNLVGLRKLECTYNAIRNDYHPHFHFIVQSKANAELLVSEWLKRNPTATIQAQDLRIADNNSVFELFKYFTKIISNKAIYVKPLDIIFQAIKGLRTYQAFGLKMITEDIEELQSEIYTYITKVEHKVWKWLESDWVDEETGEVLTKYLPNDDLKKLLNNLKSMN
jgi:Replication protein